MSSSAFIPFLGPEKTQYLMNSVRAKLVSLNIYSDDTLLEYIMVLVGNNHPKEKVYEELVLFMEPALTEHFVLWLFGEIEQLMRVQVEPVPVPVVASVPVPVTPSVQPALDQPLLSNDIQMGTAAGPRSRSFTKAVESATSQPAKPPQQQRTFSQATSTEPQREPARTRDFAANANGNTNNTRRSARLSKPATLKTSSSPKRSSSDRIVSRGEAPRAVNVDESGRVQKIRLAVDFERDERRRGRKRFDSEPQQAAAPVIKTKCQYWPNCKAGAACPNVHPSEPCKHFPNCSRGDACTFLHPVIPCRFQERCTNPLCNYQHRAPLAMAMAPVTAIAPAVPGVTPAMPVAAPSSSSALGSIPCRFYPRCINPACPYLHPVKVACRYGLECSRPGCHFEHPEGRKAVAKSAIYQPCRYGKQCARVDCPYLHEAEAAGQVGEGGQGMEISPSLPTAME